MNDLESLRDHLKSLWENFESGNYKDAALSLSETIAELVGLSGVFFATAETAETAEECQQYCEKLKTALNAPPVQAEAAKPQAAGSGALGDGHFLKLLFDSLPAILAFISQFLQPKPGA